MGTAVNECQATAPSRYDFARAIHGIIEDSTPHAREYVGGRIVGGPCTPDELAACRAVGMVNATYGLFEAIDAVQERAPRGWRVTYSWATHGWHPQAPSIPAADNEPILMGFIRVHPADPHYPVWLYRLRQDLQD